MARPGLTARRIVDTARTVADEDGLEAVTLRRLADELGTGAASLYRHIDNRADLLTLLAADFIEGYPLVPAGRRSPQEAAVRQWVAMRRYVAEHPWSATLIASGGFHLEDARAVADHCVELLEATGLSRTRALRCYRSLWHLLLGEALNAHAVGHLHDAPPEGGDFAWAARALIAGAASVR
ncbi:TetR/AcrR family transcriptional regulator [Luteipulveratus mongoliensis]|uniref:HTH tetR-type domain-containing protein n=1 Tax=Luteipulveratus mongoliensis TaxID=571913 RepID=A0A0K1JMV8_9MICO|nr:TetR/AcrR family transcriptional regulator [Luteipulveratus mongoliensis]AKU17918.1 hypothetical protein VV02_22055 [Luteipulveratus mongoliensis]